MLSSMELAWMLLSWVPSMRRMFTVVTTLNNVTATMAQIMRMLTDLLILFPMA